MSELDWTQAVAAAPIVAWAELRLLPLVRRYLAHGLAAARKLGVTDDELRAARAELGRRVRGGVAAGLALAVTVAGCALVGRGLDKLLRPEGVAAIRSELHDQVDELVTPAGVAAIRSRVGSE